MQLEFVHTNKPPFVWHAARLSMGKHADNDLVLDDQGVADHHVILHNQGYGLVLEVLPGARRVYVNARPVRESALLDFGDNLHIGGCRLRLVDRVEDADTSALDDLRKGHAVAALKAVTGELSGQVMGLDKPIVVDADGRLASPSAVPVVIIRQHGALIELKTNTDAVVKKPRVNGVEVEHVCLRDGDQIDMAGQRFVLSITADRVLQHSSQDSKSGLDVTSRVSTHHQSLWLVITAVTLAVVVAGLLLLPH